MTMLRHLAILLVVVVTTVTGNSSNERCKEVGAKIVKRGCYKDSRESGILQEMLTNQRNKITWESTAYGKFLDAFLCECARLAKERKFRYFGLQYYGECWSGDFQTSKLKESKQCLSYDYNHCIDSSEAPCIGEERTNFVYEIVFEETETNICEQLSPCQNQAECISSGDSYLCKCLPGFTGQNCEEVIDVDDCAGSPCVNGECIDGVNSYQCKCNPGYEGKNCETNINDCSASPCVNGECIDGVNSYQCKCNLGYEGKNCETNVDDCAGSPCVNGECIDGVNSYQCKCNPGYEGENCETNVDDCAGSPCVNGECIDGVNSYQCKCNSGYEGKKCDRNIDECAMKPCRNGGRCIDKVNSYQCVCKAGYNGVKCETNIDDCAKRPCRNGGRCVDKVNSYQCVCKAGYNGVNCETNINECVGNKCVRGKCVDGINSYQCECDYGYEGDKCDQAIVKPSSCVVKNWWKSFDVSGWSKCSSTNYFITGFYRSAPKKDEDPIYLLEEAKCCNAIPLLSSRAGECKVANWGKSLDKNNRWSVCPSGYFLNGLERSQGLWSRDNLHRIEKGHCCRPKNHPDWYENCYDEDVGRSFDNIGWSSCSRTGYYVAGVYRGNGADWLHNIAKFRCCQMTSVVTCETANWVHSFDKKGWSTCSKNNRFITGFYRSKQGAFWKDEIYRLENAKCCSAGARYEGEDGRCVDQNWVRTLDNKRTWATCPSGYFLNGLERSTGNNVHNIERGRCCRPKNHPAKYGACYDEDIKDEFDDAGWALCAKGGYVVGVYRNNGDKLHDIQKLRCCKMWA